MPSPHAHARLKQRDATKARAVPGVRRCCSAEDIPGLNDVGPVVHDEALLATDEVHFLGQAVALVVGESYDACRAGGRRCEAVYELLPALTTIEAARRPPTASSASRT